MNITGDAWIPSLAEHGLGTVPGYRVNLETGDEDETWRTDPDPAIGWFAWRDAVRRLRVVVQARCETDLAFRAAELERCRSDPAYFIAMWLVVEEPRPEGEEGEDDVYLHDMLKEFIPFAYQVKLVQLFAEIVKLKAKLDVFISKARGIGVSYTMMAVAWWAFLFRPYRGRFLSEKLEKVDRSMDLDSLFGKIDLFREYTPSWMWPAEFNPFNRTHRVSGMFKAPKSRAQLTGEATTANSLRGGRATYVCNDETAYQENYRDTRATISGASPHIWDWSSESYIRGRQWQTAWQTAKRDEAAAIAAGVQPVAYVIELEWDYNPYQDRVWYAEEYARYAAQGNSDAFAVEYLRNPDSGYGTLVYPTARDCPDTDGWYMPDRSLFWSVDPGIEDECAWAAWQTYFPGGAKMIRWVDGYQRSKMPVSWWAHFITGIDPVPGDEAYSLRETFHEPRVRRIMDWLKTVPPHSVKYYGDPAVRQRDSSLNSFQIRLNQESQRIRAQAGHENPIPVHIMVPHEIIHKRNNFHDRRTSMREALMHSEFSRSEGAQEVKEAFFSVRNQELTEKTTRPPGTLHDRFSHYTQAGEFGMVYEELRLTVSEVAPQTLPASSRPVRQKQIATPRGPYGNKPRPVAQTTMGAA